MIVDFYLDLDSSNPEWNKDFLRNHGFFATTKPSTKIDSMDRIKITVDLPSNYFSQISQSEGIVTDLEVLKVD